MAKYLRYILKQGGLLKGDQGCLNSYSIILMVIAFLQNQEDPILPNLQEDEEKKDSNSDLTFYATHRNKYGRTNVKKVKYSLKEDLHKLKEEFDFKNQKTVSELVLEFLADFFLTDKITSTSKVDVAKGGFIQEQTDQYSYIDIVEPFSCLLYTSPQNPKTPKPLI